MLDRLEALLREAARTKSTLSYREIAERLELRPPNTIRQTTELLEALMRLQAETGEPQLASLAVSRTRGGLPGPGFFALLSELGLYAAGATEADARAFHQAEKQRCFDAAEA